MKVYCCGCHQEVKCVNVLGKDKYPHSLDLVYTLYWQCLSCGLFVGCHKGTNKPLGVIATKEIKYARYCIHKLLDPIWKNGKKTRSVVYKTLSTYLGKEYHTADIRSLEEARNIYKFIKRKLQ